MNWKTHYSHQFVNGELVASHAGGHVPFLADVTSVLLYGQKNLISVAVNNTLTDITVPQGDLRLLQT
jgi:beta-glucuronidase